MTRPILVVIDGAKALAGGARAVFDHPVIARCQLHKIRNVKAKLPKGLADTVAKKMHAAYQLDSALAAQAALEDLARQLDKTHPGRPGRSARDSQRPSPSCASACHPPWPARCARPTPSSR